MYLLKIGIIFVFFITAFTGVGTGQDQVMIGIASFYGDGEKLNKHTASGEVFQPELFTCASWDYPFGTYLKVTCIKSGLSTIVRVNDRGPAKHLNRIIDLTKRAFTKIANPQEGLIEVEIEVIDDYGGNNK